MHVMSPSANYCL